MSIEPELAQEAADWALKLGADAVDDAKLSAEDWMALTAWLEADPARCDALEAAEVLLATFPPVARVSPILRPRARRRLAAVFSLAVAAGVAAVVFLPHAATQASHRYVTGASPALVTLADGSSVVLDRRTELVFTFRRGERQAALSPSGRVLFDVVHDPARPFTLTVGDDVIRVLGTRFDVDDGGGRLRVAVARGLVAVTTASQPGRMWVVAAGRRFAETDAGPAVRPVAGGAVDAWTRGQLVYDDAPWSDVAVDLSRQWGRPVHVDATLARASFSGVLQIGGADWMARQLELVANVSVQGDQGGTILKAHPAQS